MVLLILLLMLFGIPFLIVYWKEILEFIVGMLILLLILGAILRLVFWIIDLFS